MATAKTDKVHYASHEGVVSTRVEPRRGEASRLRLVALKAYWRNSVSAYTLARYGMGVNVICVDDIFDGKPGRPLPFGAPQ